MLCIGVGLFIARKNVARLRERRASSSCGNHRPVRNFIEPVNMAALLRGINAATTCRVALSIAGAEEEEERSSGLDFGVVKSILSRASAWPIDARAKVSRRQQQQEKVMSFKNSSVVHRLILSGRSAEIKEKKYVEKA